MRVTGGRKVWKAIVRAQNFKLKLWGEKQVWTGKSEKLPYLASKVES